MALLVATVLGLPLAGEDAATEGRKVITGMLIVGLIVISVIVLGELTHHLRHRRR